MIFILGPSKDGEKRKTRPRPVGYPARAGTLLPAPQAHPSGALRALAPAGAPQAPPRGQARPIAHGPSPWARGPVAVRPRARRRAPAGPSPCARGPVAGRPRARRAPVALRPRARARAPLHRAPPCPSHAPLPHAFVEPLGRLARPGLGDWACYDLRALVLDAGPERWWGLGASLGNA